MLEKQNNKSEGLELFLGPRTLLPGYYSVELRFRIESEPSTKTSCPKSSKCDVNADKNKCCLDESALGAKGFFEVLPVPIIVRLIKTGINTDVIDNTDVRGSFCMNPAVLSTNPNLPLNYSQVVRLQSYLNV